MRWRTIILTLITLAILLAMVRADPLAAASARTKSKSVADRLKEYGGTARARLKPYFQKAQIPYPPAELTFIGLKEEQSLEIYARSRAGAWRLIHQYPILAASGGPGPKLKEGDGQVPEGFYRIESLNPNSLFHLSLRVNYPNEFDRQQAAREGRTKLGGDIMIHGNQVSIGCLAMGDSASEDLFVLAADTGLDNITVILVPHDFRVKKQVPLVPNTSPWLPGLYQSLAQRLQNYPAK